MGPVLNFGITPPERGSRTLFRSLHSQLRASIFDGRLKPGLRLPATRTFAKTYGVSRNTAVAIYDLLTSEGYLVTRQTAGTFVADVLPPFAAHVSPANKSERDRRLNTWWRAPRAACYRPTPQPDFDFQVGVPDQTQFPFHVWRRLSARALRRLAKMPATYADPSGECELRAAIVSHVSFARAVACRPQDVTVTSGAQQGFDLLARTLVTPRRTVVAVENPGYPPACAAFAAAGARLVPIPVDEEGLIVERLPKSARIIYVTPSHQYPLGVVLSMRRRIALLEFARTNGAVVIEDDYDGEFRFGGRPLDALQTLDRGESVFYVGTFSKSMFPSIRIGYVVAPPWARDALAAAKQLTDWHTAVPTQHALAEFIAEGHLACHVRKVHRMYDERRKILLRCLETHFASLLTMIPSMAGLHLTTLFERPVDAEALVQKARDTDIGINSLRRFFVGRPTKIGLAFGYGGIDGKAIEGGLERLRPLLSR